MKYVTTITIPSTTVNNQPKKQMLMKEK